MGCVRGGVWERGDRGLVPLGCRQGRPACRFRDETRIDCILADAFC